MHSVAEENYLKTILKYCLDHQTADISNVELANLLKVKPSTVNDMLKKLKNKSLVNNKPYGKISLTDAGNKIATQIIRKHRLWETFLVEKLNFSWDEVHEIAEQLEHIQSVKLIDRLDELLGFPETDPHGDSIPGKNGKIKNSVRIVLSNGQIQKRYRITGVLNNSHDFLKYLFSIGLVLQSQVKIISKFSFDHSIEIELGKKRVIISEKIAAHLFVEAM